MPDVVGALGGRKERERARDERDDLVEAARPRGAQEGFQLGERLLDGIEVGTVGRQEAQVGACRFNLPECVRVFVDREIVSPSRRRPTISVWVCP